MLEFLAAHTALQALIKVILLLILFVMPLASLSTWAERRQSAMMQDRLGPNRANIGPIKLWGILHFVADAIKMIFKEDIVPAKVDRFLFALAPPLAALACVPFCFGIVRAARRLGLLAAELLGMLRARAARGRGG